jgi:hypothetical protein
MATPTRKAIDVAREIVAEYDPGNHGSAKLSTNGQTWRLELVTGGWSENEEFIGDLRSVDNVKQSRWMFWMTCWESSHRGGLHVFTGTMEQPIYGRP